MILLISTCAEKLHELEFVKPIEDVLEKNNFKYQTIHYSKLTDNDLKKAEKIIICGTSLKDNEFMNHINKFEFIKTTQKPVLGICAGAHMIGILFDYKLKKKKEIGLKKLLLKKEFLGLKGEKQVYHLHNFQVLPETWRHKTKEIYSVLFHPEVRNKNLVVNFCKN